MKKISIVLMSLITAFAITTTASAMSVEFGFGLGMLGDAGGMGATILDDGLEMGTELGTIDNAGNTSATYNEIILVENEQSLTDAADAGTITNFTKSGPMIGMNFGLQINFKFSYFFARTGFDYTMKIAGGKSTWTDSRSSTTEEREQTWGYTSWDIPFSLGINVPVMEDKVNLYMGLSMAWMNGGWEVQLKSVDVRTTASNYSAAGNNKYLTVNADETPTFTTSGLGIGYLIGVDAEVYDNVAVFFEFQSLTLVNIETYTIENATIKTLSPTLSKAAIVGGSFLKFGAKYKLSL